MQTVAVIGSGFSGLSAAAVLAKSKKHVVLFEKNAELGGRARIFRENGFLFDMGPSWYWMPDVFEKYYNLFGYTTSDFYELKKLDPGFNVIFSKNEVISIPADFEKLCELFETLEKGSSVSLGKFMKEAELKYRIGVQKLVYKPGLSFSEFLDGDVIRNVVKLQLFSSYSEHVGKYFKDPRIRAIMEFPVLFLGAMPKDTPALYSLMNYAGLKLGTYYPMGGFSKVVDAFHRIAIEQGVEILTSSAIEQLEVESGKVSHVRTNTSRMAVDAVVGSADYHHIENSLLSSENRAYNDAYWERKIFAPSCLIFYLGVNKKIDRLQHHNLFFDADLQEHSREIYTTKQWPKDPLFYVCCPSKTDPSVAPEGNENLFILMPIATGLDDPDENREFYFNKLLSRIEDFTGSNVREHIVFKRSYSVSDFVKDYNSYKGNAYGLANTLFQTAIYKPKLRSKKIKNLFFAGQLTVPGPGVPPSIISGQVAAKELLKILNK